MNRNQTIFGSKTFICLQNFCPKNIQETFIQHKKKIWFCKSFMKKNPKEFQNFSIVNINIMLRLDSGLDSYQTCKSIISVNMLLLCLIGPSHQFLALSKNSHPISETINMLRFWGGKRSFSLSFIPYNIPSLLFMLKSNLYPKRSEQRRRRRDEKNLLWWRVRK